MGLIEKTHDNKVIKAITKMVEDWVKIKVTLTNLGHRIVSDSPQITSSEKLSLG